MGHFASCRAAVLMARYIPLLRALHLLQTSFVDCAGMAYAYEPSCKSEEAYHALVRSYDIIIVPLFLVSEP